MNNSDDQLASLINPLTPTGKIQKAANKSSPFQSSGSHSKQSSGDDDEFGSFISVAASEDPLNDVENLKSSNLDRSSSQFFGKEVIARAESNERRVMDELRAHDEDPLGWLSNSLVQDASKEKIKENMEMREGHEFLRKPSDGGNELRIPSNHAAQTDQMLSALREAEQTLIDFSSPELRPPNTSTIPRTLSDTLLHHTQSSPQHFNHSPPKSPTQSTASIGRSWMSSLGLLSSPLATPASYTNASARGSHEPTRDSSPEPPNGNHRLSMSPTQSSLHAIFSRASPPSSSGLFTRHSRHATDMPTRSPIHAATMPLPSPSLGSVSSFATASATLTDDPSPFSPHMYVPPSGAPGFTGERNWNPGDFDFDVKKAGPTGMGGKGIELVGRKDATTPVLDSKLADALRPHLPALARLPSRWELLYSADQHGLSLKTLYARCTPPMVVGGGGILSGSPSSKGAMVVIQDADGDVFGAWIGEGIHLSHGSYYGGGDSFLWRRDKSDPSGLKVYNWTGRNDYVAYCDMDGFSFGGGDGHYGLYLDSSLIEGTTHPCPTFDNDCLAQGVMKGRMISFDAVGLEIWGVGS